MNETIQKDLGWLKRHEKLIIIVLAAILIWFLWGKYVDWQAKHDDTAAAIARTKLEQQVEDNAKIAQIVANNEQNFKVLLAQVTAQNQVLANAVATRDRNTQQQQATNLALPLPDLAKRWVQLLNIPQAEVQAANVPDKLIVTDNAARTTVNQLEEVPRLTGNLAAEKQAHANDVSLLKDRDKAVVDLNAQVTGKDAEIEKQAVANKAEQDKLKADARKAKRNWLIRGMVIGGAGTAWALHALGMF